MKTWDLVKLNNNSIPIARSINHDVPIGLTRLTCPNPAQAWTGISQDDEAATNELVQRWETAFPVQLDPHLALSRAFDLAFVPSLFLIAPETLQLRGHPTQRTQRMILMRSDYKPRKVVVNTRDAD